MSSSDLETEVRRLREEVAAYQLGFPPGHFYSPIPSLDLVREREHEIFNEPGRTLPEVDLNESGQLALLAALARFYGDQPFVPEPSPQRGYHFENDYFRYGEALVLYGMLRHVRPRRLIEIGSGYSSAAILDISDLFFDGGIECVFVDPQPEMFRELVSARSYQSRYHLMAQGVQDVAGDVFERLEAGDVLFVDSTHVSKIDSDVNHLVFRVLPLLERGVYVHFHDIYYPFEYPREWIFEGRAWNEAYVLRAFLQCNPCYEILFFNSYLAHTHLESFVHHMPLCRKGTGSSLWLRKVRAQGASGRRRFFSRAPGTGTRRRSSRRR